MVVLDFAVKLAIEKALASRCACALDLCKYMRKGYGDYFSIQVAGYPEGHPDNIKKVADLGRPMSATEKVRCLPPRATPRRAAPHRALSPRTRVRLPAAASRVTGSHRRRRRRARPA